MGSWELFRYGKATKTDARHSVAHIEHDRVRRLAAKQALKRPAVRFNGLQARAIAHGFGNYLRKSKLTVWACAILPDHVHLVTGPAHFQAEQLVIQLKGAATEQLIEEGIHPFGGVDKCFARGEWKVYLDPLDVPRAIRYAESNPEKEGLRRQRWSFVTPTLVSRDAKSSQRSAVFGEGELSRSAPKTPRRG